MPERGIIIIITTPSNDRRLAPERMRSPHSADPSWAIFKAGVSPVFGACYRPDKPELSPCICPVISPWRV
jgi:hypothetical protein